MNLKHLLLGGVTLMLVSCGSYVRIGDLTGVSNRNIDNGKKYVLLNRDVEALANREHDALEEAIDNLTKEYKGEFLRNVKIYVKNNGKKVKIIGDVWGIQRTEVKVTTTAEANIQLAVRDFVLFNKKGKITKGKIIGLNRHQVVVEYGKRNNKQIELKYDEVTKTNK